MAKHRAERTCRNKTPLRKSAASVVIATMLFGGIGVSTASAGVPETGSTITTTDEASDVRTMRAVISPKEGGDYEVAFEDAERILIEHQGVSYMSSAHQGVPVATSAIYSYEATLQGSNANLAVEPVTEALEALPKERTAHVNVLASEPGKLRFSLIVTTHHDQEEEEADVESRTVRAILHVDENERVSVSLVGTTGIAVRELDTSIVSSHVFDQGISVATTYFNYEVTSIDGTNFNYDIDLNVDELAELEGAHGVKIVTTSQTDDGTMRFFIAVSREFPIEVEPDESDEAPDAEVAPATPEVTTPEVEEVPEEVAKVDEAPEAEDVVEEASEVIAPEVEPEVEEGAEVDEVPATEEAPSSTPAFRVSSAQAPAVPSDEDAPADTPASIRERANGGVADSGSGDAGEDRDEAPLVITPGEGSSTSDQLAPPVEDGERVPPRDIRADGDVTAETREVPSQATQESLAETGVSGMAGVIAAITTALGAAALVVRRKFLGGASA